MERVLAVNLKGFLCSQAVAKVMVARASMGGSLVWVTDFLMVGGAQQAHYCQQEASAVDRFHGNLLGAYGMDYLECRTRPGLIVLNCTVRPDS